MGRPRKTNAKRYPGGQIVHERVSDIKATVHAHRRKLGANSDNIESAHWENALGRAYERGQIERHHLEAGQHYQRLCVSYARIKGIPSPFPRSVELMAELRGAQGGDFDAQFVRDTCKSFTEAFEAIANLGVATSRTVHAVLKQDFDCKDWSVLEMSRLVDGLSVLVELFKVPTEDVDAA